MKRWVLMVAALAVMIGGCSKEEEQAQKAPEPKSEQPAMSAPEQMEEMAGDAMEETASMAEDAASGAEQVADEAAAALEENAAEAEAAVEEQAAEAEAAVEEAVTETRESVAETMDQAAEAVAPAGAGRGKEIYDSACFACHATGAAGAPKMGDKAAWEPRIAQGMDILYNHSINGIRAMPPKGGYMHLADEEVKQAVDYMVSQSQ